MELEVISHSWGTVVAYEALHRLDRSGFHGRVRTLFTVGSALSIGRAQRRLHPRRGRKPPLVDHWINLDAKGDMVGGRLDGEFEVDEDYHNLHPATCDGWAGFVSPGCAHSSYFQASNIPVNRDIFARRIAETRAA
jgi:pimeloyl-ACP methyl ester carboxylesterase